MGQLGSNTEAQSHVLIVGGSARSAAQSAVRAGLTPICADTFADEDLRAIAQVIPVASYPHDLPDVARLAPDCPWMYTGALENRPQIIAAISARRTLWGNPPETLARVRDPFELQKLLLDAGLPTAAVRSAAAPPVADGNWLIKPLRGAAGRGIAAWCGKASPSMGEPHYFQERIDGLPCSAVLIATRNRAHLVGMSRQRIGDPLLNAAGFGYSGSSGPIFFEPKIIRQIAETADVIARWAKLRGVFGIDMVFNGTAAVPIEINPRYTASVEIFEHAYDIAVLNWHRLACETFDDPSMSAEIDDRIDSQLQPLVAETGQATSGDSIQHVEKAILFADRVICTPSLEEGAVRKSDGLNVLLVDRPPAGTRIGPGQPVCSLLVIGADEAACRQRMDCEVDQLKESLCMTTLRRDDG